MNNTKKVLIILSVMIIVTLLLVYVFNGVSKNKEIAACLTAHGAIMFGTEWCPHCKEQKSMFGEAFSLIKYIDCDEEPKKCQEASITGYPTWVFKDNVILEGTQTIKKLKEAGKC